MNVSIAACYAAVLFATDNVRKHMKKIKIWTTTEKATALLTEAGMTKVEMAEMIGVSRPTLDTRLKEGNWKKLETKEIEKAFSVFNQ